MQEIEGKILEIDLAQTRKKLESLGAKLVLPQAKFEYYTFDHPQLELRKKDSNLRLRRCKDEKCGELTFKGPKENTLFKERQEINVQIEDFEQMYQLLGQLKFFSYRHREKLREEWQWQDCKIEIDTYPGIPTYLEIEGESEESVLRLAGLLGFRKEDLKTFTATEVLHYYKVPAEGGRSVSNLHF